MEGVDAKSSIQSQSVNSYLSAVMKVLEYLENKEEIEVFIEALSPENLKRMIPEHSLPLAYSVHKELKALYSGLRKGLIVDKIVFKLLVNLLAHKVVMDEHIPYLLWLREQLSYRRGVFHYDEFYLAVDELIREHEDFWEGIKNEVLKTVLEESGKYLSEAALKKVVWATLKKFFVDRGLTIALTGKLANAVSLGVGLGLLVSDILFDAPGMVWETHRQLAAYSPSYYYLKSLGPCMNVSLSFNVSVTEPGMHAVSFLINVGNGEVILHRVVFIYVYNGRIFFSVEPATPRFNEDVTVTVYDEKFNVLPNATVILQNSLGNMTLVTDENGVACFKANVTGVWFLTIYAKGYPVVAC